MKNIVKVLRFKDNAARFYALPDGMSVTAGTIVTVEYPDKRNTAVGVALSDSYTVDGENARMVQQFSKMTPAAWDSMKHVTEIHQPVAVVWPDDTEADTETGEADTEAEDEDDYAGFGEALNP